MVRAILLATLGLASAFVPATPAQSPAKEKKSAAVKPIPARVWHSRGLGGLIEGTCTGVKGDVVKIVLGANDERLIPVELFLAEDVEFIRKHFGITEPMPAQTKVEPPPRSECGMFNTIRGGVLPAAKIIGHDGNTIFLADEKGLKYRVPYFLFAEGVKGSVRDAITKLDGKPFQPVDDSKPKVAASKAGRTTAKGGPTTQPTSPVGGGQGGRVLGQTPKAGTGTVIGTLPRTEAPMPIGESRTWTMRGGKRTWKGKFLELRPPFVNIQTPEGKTAQLPLELLEEADRQYAETLAKGGKVGEAPKGALVVSREARFISSADGKPLYLLDGRTLHALASDGKPTGVKQTLAADYLFLGERADYWLAATQKELHLVDKKTFRPKATHSLWKYKRINDVSLHPSRPFAVVSVEHVLDETLKNPAENQRIVLVEEKDGKIHEPDEAYGAWVRVHPSGKYLFAGFHLTYKSGPDWEIGPNFQKVRRLNYEHTDILNRFRIDGFDLKVDGQFKNAGTNGQGVVLSPDGNRVSYLSFTGYPTLSYNVIALEASDFNRQPITFALKDKGDCTRLIYDPSSRLAASPAKGGAVLFDARTGGEVSGRLAADSDLTEAVVHDLAFSADGKHLTFIASRNGSPRYVKSVTLQAR